MCPALVDKEKLIRDQAQKSIDIYIARIKKFAATMPDSVLPSPSVAAAGGASPRMGTPANESSWAGWAISSFTNKLASTSGQMQAGGAPNGAADQRSSSVPPGAATLSKSSVPLASKPGMTLHNTKSAATIPTIQSPDPAASFDDEEDFNNDWGGFANDDNKPREEEEDPWGTPAVSKPTPTTSFDDKGEPDFAGWLAAQSNAKKTTKTPLPKGLTKSSAPTAKSTRPVVGGRSSTTPSTAKKVIVPPKKEVKKEIPKADDEEEEGWGDAW
jgi:SCY1-like protein 1